MQILYHFISGTWASGNFSIWGFQYLRKRTWIPRDIWHYKACRNCPGICPTSVWLIPPKIPLVALSFVFRTSEKKAFCLILEGTDISKVHGSFLPFSATDLAGHGPTLYLRYGLVFFLWLFCMAHATNIPLSNPRAALSPSCIGSNSQPQPWGICPFALPQLL